MTFTVEKKKLSPRAGSSGPSPKEIRASGAPLQPRVPALKPQKPLEKPIQVWYSKGHPSTQNAVAERRQHMATAEARLFG